LKAYNNFFHKTFEAVIITASFFTIIGCTGDAKWMKQIEEGDFSIVKRGRVHQAGRKINSPSNYDKIIQETRKIIEGKAEVMNLIQEKYFPDIQGNLNFQYDFSSLDGKNERIILRYIGKLPKPQIYYGVSIQFGVDLNSKEVVLIYTTLVPLE
jgi:hypothetical protein